MDEHFDTVRTCKKTRNGKCVRRAVYDGYLQALVTDSLTVGGKDPGGKARRSVLFLPFLREHGFSLVRSQNNSVLKCSNPYRGVLAHEVGHVSGLKHTFDRGICVKDYGTRRRGSIKPDGSVNLMDYGRSINGCSRSLYLNSCQKRRAARYRRFNDVSCRVSYRRMQ